MDIDPHSIQQLLEKIRSQLRCPQCTRRVDVALGSLKVVGETFAVFQLQCQTCDAYLLLHATLRLIVPVGDGVRTQPGQVVADGKAQGREQWNISTTLQLAPQELALLRASLKEAGGSFAKLFQSP